MSSPREPNLPQEPNLGLPLPEKKGHFSLGRLERLLRAPLAALSAADAPKPTVKVTQELLNSIHVTPKLIFDPFPAYAQEYLPFAMAASMEVTHKGRLWTCWAGGQDGANAPTTSKE